MLINPFLGLSGPTWPGFQVRPENLVSCRYRVIPYVVCLLVLITLVCLSTRNSLRARQGLYYQTFFHLREVDKPGFDRRKKTATAKKYGHEE